MIPSPWIGLVLALAAFRITRLIGWDDLPPVARARAWVTGASMRSQSTSNTAMRLTNDESKDTWVYKRPLLAHMITCPYCMGFWVAAVTYIAWVFVPTQMLYVAAVFALSGAIGIIARMLDP